MKLGVNIDHIATLRQARGGKFPDPVDAARVCKRAGAHAVVMHLREDRRHIQDDDLFLVKRLVPIRLNMEMSITPSIVDVAVRLMPHQATLVPEKRMERTTEGGLDLLNKVSHMHRAVGRLKEKGIEISLFIDPQKKQIEAAKKMGVPSIELHTGDYANARGPRVAHELKRLKEASKLARSLSLHVYAGHGLDYRNVLPIARIPGMEELNIGYSIVTRALWIGFDAAVCEMLSLLRKKI